MGHNLSDLEAGGEFGGIEALVEKRSENTTKTGKPYLNLTIRDKTKSLNAKIWDYNPVVHGRVQEGTVCSFSGSVDTYQGNLQLKIHTVDISTNIVMDFAKSTRFNV